LSKFKIETADTAKLKATVEEAATSGSIVANVRVQAAENGVPNESEFSCVTKTCDHAAMITVAIKVVELVTAPATPVPTPDQLLSSGIQNILRPGRTQLRTVGKRQVLHLTKASSASKPAITLLAGRNYDGVAWESAPPVLLKFTCAFNMDSAP
jgi:hypothetical protein